MNVFFQVLLLFVIACLVIYATIKLYDKNSSALIATIVPAAIVAAVPPIFGMISKRTKTKTKVVES